MIVLPDGKICRNLPEQVAENLKKIQEIIHFLDGVNIQDNLVVIADLSQILTEAELEVVERPVAFIYYNAELYIKKNEAAGVAYFVNVFSIEDTGTQLNFNSHEMQVNLGTGALTYTTATATSYTKSQIDSLLALKADLSGAEFTGAVKALTLEQTQANWSQSLTLGTIDADITIENIYNRFLQLSAELLLIVNFKLTNTSASSKTLYTLAQQNGIILPENISTKLFDFKGSSAHEALSANCVIAVERAVWSVTADASGVRNNNINIIFENQVSADRVNVKIGNPETGSVLAAGQTVYCTGRIVLSLI